MTAVQHAVVPVEPTPEMLRAGFHADDLATAWAVMLAAAPAVQLAAGREEIARIIDPWPFGIVANIQHAERAAVEREKALAKSDRILAAISTPAQASETGGERDYPAEFEAWWKDYKHRNREAADYWLKKQIAFDAFYFAALSAPQAAPGEGEGES